MSKPNNVCGYCNEIFVVDSLARICEMKHEGVIFIKEEYKPRPSQRLKKDKEE